MSCNGEYPSDNEVLGPVTYYPQRGFPAYFYPFTNVPGYLSPLIAVQFKRPGCKKNSKCYLLRYIINNLIFLLFFFIVNRIINIECRAWAKNIIYNGSFRDRQGSVHFEIMID